MWAYVVLSPDCQTARDKNFEAIVGTKEGCAPVGIERRTRLAKILLQRVGPRFFYVVRVASEVEPLCSSHRTGFYRSGDVDTVAPKHAPGK